MRFQILLWLAMVGIGCNRGPGAPKFIVSAVVVLDDLGSELSVGFILFDADRKDTLRRGQLSVTIKDDDGMTCSARFMVDPAQPPPRTRGLYELKSPMTPRCLLRPGLEYRARVSFECATGVLDLSVPVLAGQISSPRVRSSDPRPVAEAVVDAGSDEPSLTPWPPNPNAPPAVIDMHEDARGTITRNLGVARQRIDQGKDPVNACQAAMVLNRIHRELGLQPLVRQVCLEDASLFWASQLAEKIDKQKKPASEECTAARKHLALAADDDRRTLLAKRLDRACGPVKASRCTVDTEAGEVSGVEGGLPCPEAEELARKLRQNGLDAKVVPAAR